MSRLIQIDPEAKLNPEPEGYEFGYHAFEDLEPIKTDIQEIRTFAEPISLPQEEIKLPLSDEKLFALQAEDKFCNDISSKLQQGKLQDKNSYYKETNCLVKLLKAKKIETSLGKRIVSVNRPSIGVVDDVIALTYFLAYFMPCKSQK